MEEEDGLVELVLMVCDAKRLAFVVLDYECRIFCHLMFASS